MSRNRENGTKKKHGCLTTLIVFVVIIAVIGAGGYLYLRSNAPDEVVYSQSDVNSFYEKMDIETGDYAFTIKSFLEGSVVSSGSKDVETIFTSEEITGGLQSGETSSQVTDGLNQAETETILVVASVFPVPGFSAPIEGYAGKGMFKNVNVRFTGKDEMEVFGTVTSRINELYAYAPELKSYAFAIDQVIDTKAYCKLHITYDAVSGIQLDVLTITVGGVPVPNATIDNYEADFANQVNIRMNQLEGLEIEVLEITDQGLVFKGSVPAEIRNIDS